MFGYLSSCDTTIVLLLHHVSTTYSIKIPYDLLMILAVIDDDHCLVIYYFIRSCKVFLVAQKAKNMPAIQKLGSNPGSGKIPWEKGMTTHSSFQNNDLDTQASPEGD